MLYWIFCPGHAGVIGNQRADTLPGQAPISRELNLDPPTVLANVNDFLLMHEPLTNSYTLDALKEKWQAAQMYEPDDDGHLCKQLCIILGPRC